MKSSIGIATGGGCRGITRAGAVLALCLWSAPSVGLSAAKAAARPVPNGRPNVIFLLTDDQRADTVAALGNPHIITPNLDRLVHEGLVFRNAYCMGGYVGAVCLPSRQMVMTGRSWFAVRDLDKSAPSLPRSMNDAGYVTYHYGKRGNTPVDIQSLFQVSKYLQDMEDRTSGYPMRTIADDAVQFIAQRAAANDGKPFFMYLAPANPHDPRVAAPQYMARYRAEDIPLPANFLPWHPFDNGDLGVRDERLAPWPRTEENIRAQTRDYYAVITAMDEQFGRIVAALHETGQYDKTVFVFSSDQGIALGSHGLMGKQNLYQPSMNAPLVFAGPGIPRGQSSEALAYLFDIYPTILDLAGAEMPAGLDGMSLLPVIRQETAGVRESVFLAYRDVQRAVRQGAWKLIRYPQIGKTQLFNLAADPAETRDLAGEPAQAARIRQMLTLMAAEQRRYGDTQSLVVPGAKPGEVDLEYFASLPEPAKRPAGKNAASGKRGGSKRAGGKGIDAR